MQKTSLKKRYTSIFLISFLSLLLHSCSSDKSNSPKEPTLPAPQITGALYQSNGNPAKNATIRFLTTDHNPTPLPKKLALTDSVITDANGDFQLETLAEGTYNLFAEGGRELSFRDSINIVEGEPKDLGRDTLKETGSLT